MTDGGKVIPIGQAKTTRERLIDALAEILVKNGFRNLTVDDVVRRAGVGRQVLYRYFGGLPDLVAAFGVSPKFWPTAEELLGPSPEAVLALKPAGRIAHFFKAFLAALTARPATLDILAWELAERTPLSKILEHVRVRTALEYFERVGGEIPEDLDLSAVVALLGAGVSYLALRSRLGGYFGGLNMWEAEDRARVDAVLELVLATLFREAAPKSPNGPRDA